MSFDPKKPLEPQIALSEEQIADIKINQSRFEEFEVTLTSVLDVIGRIDGSRRVLELLKLGEIQLNMVKRESTVHSFKEEASKAWTALRKAIHVDKKGIATLHFPCLEQLVKDLGESRAGMLNGLGRLSGTKYLGPREVATRLREAPTIGDLPDIEVPPFDPTREKDVHQAITIKGRNETGRLAIKSTLERAREKVDHVSEDVLVRAVTYYQMVLASLLRVYTMSKDTQKTAALLFEELSHGASDEAVNKILNHYNLELRIEHILGLIVELIQRIELTLKMLEQETGVDNILTEMIPGREVAKLRRKLQSEMPEGEDKENADRVLQQALHRRQEIGEQPLAIELQRRLIRINLLGQ